nr:hypothetical protein [Tanacetum cinerariifolium]
MAKTINEEVELHAQVDGKVIVTTESSVRRDLQLANEEGIDCFPDSTIFEQLAMIGLGKGFYGRVTPLFQTIVVQNQSQLGKGFTMPTDPHHTPTILQPSSSQPQKTQKPKKLKRKDTQVPQPSGPSDNVADDAAHKELGNSLVWATTTASSLEAAVLDLEKTKTTQRNEIDSLKRRVKKLEKSNKSRTHKLKRLYKVSLSARVESSRDKESLGEDASKQGRRIDAIDADEDITLVNDADNDMFDVDDLGGEVVFVKGKNDNVVEEVVDVTQVSTAATTVTISTKEITLAQALEALKNSNPKLDKEAALKLQVEFDVEERLARERAKKEQEANITLYETWDDIQAKIDDDHQIIKKRTKSELKPDKIKSKQKAWKCPESSPIKSKARILEDKIICDLDKTPDLSQRSPQNCPKFGNPVDGHYCQGCALPRKKFKEDLFTSCVENRILRDSSEPSNDNANIANALQEPFVVNQDPGKNSSQSPPQINHHCCYGCGDPLECIFCHQCTCELCGNGAHYGYNCPPKVSIIPDPEPFNNQTIKELPQTVPSLIQHATLKMGIHSLMIPHLILFMILLTLSTHLRNFLCILVNFAGTMLDKVIHEAYQCQPMNEDYYHEQNSCYDPNYFGFDHFQPPQYIVNHPIFNVQNDLFNSQSKLMEQLTSMCDMVGQYIQKKEEEKQIEEEHASKTRYWNIPACYDDDDDDYTIAITPKEPDNSLSMGDEHLDTIPTMESDEFIKFGVENLVPNPSESEGEYEYDVSHPQTGPGRNTCLEA